MWLLAETQHSSLNQILLLICSSDVRRKIIPAWGRNSCPVSCLQGGHQGNTSCQSCRHCSTVEGAGRHICLCNTQNFPFPRRNHFSTHSHAAYCYQKRGAHISSIWLFHIRLTVVNISLQVKDRAKINIRIRFSVNLKWLMTKLSCLTTRCWNKNSSIMGQKKMLIINA